MTTETTRRALVAGLAMAPLAGVPAVAGAVAGNDPKLRGASRGDAKGRMGRDRAVDGLERPTHAIDLAQIDDAERLHDDACRHFRLQRENCSHSPDTVGATTCVLVAERTVLRP